MRIFDVAGVAELLGTSEGTVRELIKSGRLGAANIGVGERIIYRVTHAQVEAFLEASQVCEVSA